MKHKKATFAAIASLVIIVGAAITIGHFNNIQPLSVDDSPTITYSDDGQSHTNSKPTNKEIVPERADTTSSPQPEDSVPNAPKQAAIRQSVSKEYVYFPLLAANDPGYVDNWAIQKMRAPEAWNISTGNGQTVVAVIDTGFALNHNDLKNNWFNNSSETGMTSVGGQCWTGLSIDKSTNNCDDDNNGYVDDWRGWNFSLGDSNPMAGRINPSGVAVSHGTEVAGLTGAAGNNATGITTINWNTKIMPLQALSDDGPGYTSDVVAAIYYAVDNGADVINMSLGGNEYDATLKSATDYAFDNGVVVIAAAGNCGTGSESGCGGYPAGSMGYPALNDHVIAVGATTSSDQRASFSSYGPGLDVVAPGSGTINSPTWTSTNSTSLYASSLYGTSYASPQVASLASLIKSIRPNSSVDDITALILATSTKLPVMNATPYTNTMGHGLINAYSSLLVASSLNTTTATPQLLQAGGVVAEHRYTSSDTLGSGCGTATTTYCTIWLRDDITGFERYLPYQKTDQQGAAGWTWSGALIPSGEWRVKASQGDNRSTAYFLVNK